MNAAYTTTKGSYWSSRIEDWLESTEAKTHAGKINLILTSPPFPLVHKKSYGNRTGEAYVNWLAGLASPLATLLSPDGSMVIEIGNAWEQGQPTMSTLPVEALLAIKRHANLHLCQEFIIHNPARLPSPVEYVNVKRSRVKDSWTRVWWLSSTPHPKADNRRALVPYSPSMKKLLSNQTYNAGPRPSGHHIGTKSFLKDNGGSIPSSAITDTIVSYFGSFIECSNTASTGDAYFSYCREHKIKPHPARMQPGIARFFISFLTDPGETVLDPFAGSNTTGWASEQMNRRWISIECEQSNIEPSKARFQAARGDTQ